MNEHHQERLQNIFTNHNPEHYYTFKGDKSLDLIFWCEDTLYASVLIEETLVNGTINHKVENDIPRLPWASDDTVYNIIVYCNELDSYYLVEEENIDENGELFIRIEHLKSRTTKSMDWEQDYRIHKRLEQFC